MDIQYSNLFSTFVRQTRHFVKVVSVGATHHTDKNYFYYTCIVLVKIILIPKYVGLPYIFCSCTNLYSNKLQFCKIVKVT